MALFYIETLKGKRGKIALYKSACVNRFAAMGLQHVGPLFADIVALSASANAGLLMVAAFPKALLPLRLINATTDERTAVIVGDVVQIRRGRKASSTGGIHHGRHA